MFLKRWIAVTVMWLVMTPREISILGKKAPLRQIHSEAYNLVIQVYCMYLPFAHPNYILSLHCWLKTISCKCSYKSHKGKKRKTSPELKKNQTKQNKKTQQKILLLYKLERCILFPFTLMRAAFSAFPGKTQVMGEIKIALKKEMKTDGEQLIVEILQCRNITYKFKSPDHLPGITKKTASWYFENIKLAAS